MTCLTCHDPHKPSESKVVADACLKCHGPAHCKEQPRLPEAVRGNCVECHMPQRVWMNVHFHTEKDRYLPPIRRFQHRIGVYPEATREVVLAWLKGRPDGDGKAEADKLTAALVGHWLTEGDRRRKDHRFHAEIQALREALFFDPSPVVKGRLQDAITRQSELDALFGEGLKRMEEKRYPAAMESFAKMLEIDPGSAKAHARLGTLNGLLGKDALAVEHLRAAAKADPNDPYPWNMLGWIAYIQKRPADAVPEYLKALEIEPANDELLYRLGLAYLASDKWTEARATLERLYRLNPNNAGGCQALGHVFLQQRETAEAVRYGRRAAMLTESKNADILLSLCDAYAAAGRTGDALKTAELALGVTDDPGLAAQLRERRAKLGEASLSKFAR